jgi:long-chain acyl-CoA synthetase
MNYNTRKKISRMSLNEVSYEVPGTSATGWGATRRSRMRSIPPQGLPSHDGSGRVALTSYENFVHASEYFAEKRCIGYRPLRVDGTAGDYSWFTYREVREMVEHLSAGFIQMGLCPSSKGDLEIRQQPVLGIMMRNRPEWFIAEQACFLHSIIPVPFYDTASAETLAVILRKITSLQTIVCSSLTIEEIIKTKATNGDSISLSRLVVCDEISESVRAKAVQAGLSVYEFSMILEEGKKMGSNRPQHNPPSPDDIYTFCFTSGTTGEPKGALITHRGVITNSASVSERMVPFTVGDEVLLSFLPLPHMFERVCQLLAVCGGGSIGFFQGDPLKLPDDLLALRPTRFVAVPRVLNRIKDKVMSQINEKSGLVRRAFQAALHQKIHNPGNPVNVVSDAIFFKKISQKLGLDKVKQILTGSAPISADTLRWFRAVFSGCPVNEGYGQTECTLVCSLQSPEETSVGDCGGPLSCCDVRLMDVPEMGYTSADTQHGRDGDTIPCLGRGEICIRGDSVFQGYYKMEDKTREAIDENGWLHTGDIGLWTSSGQVKIIDRKKNIFKLSQGEYVAPEKIEAVLAGSKFVLQSFVYGDSFRNHLVAIIVPNPDTVKEWAQKNGFGKSLEELCLSPELKNQVLAELTATSRGAKLHGFEVVKNIHLDAQMWTSDNLLTPTFKLKRNEAEKKYKAVIDRMYVEDQNRGSKL